MLSEQFIPLQSENHKSQFFNIINNEQTETFNIEGKGIVIITVENDFSDHLRRAIENFKNHFKNITIYDAGHFKSTDELNLTSIIGYLNKSNVIPILIGIPLETIGKIAAERKNEIIQISNKITNITHTTSFIKSNFIGYQRHLIDLEDIHEIENHHYNSMSLGKIRTNPFLAEPLLRDAELLYVNPNVLRSCDCPESIETLPTGLHAEELCQLMKYTGTASNLQAIFLDTTSFNGQNKMSADLLAECIWYFAEGVNMKLNDHPVTSSDYSEFIVYSTSMDDDLIFLKHNQSARWWLQKNCDEKNIYMACSFEEYQTAIGDEISERIQKFLH
jgi:hypothetical protein